MFEKHGGHGDVVTETGQKTKRNRWPKWKMRENKGKKKIAENKKESEKKINKNKNEEKKRKIKNKEKNKIIIIII